MNNLVKVAQTIADRLKHSSDIPFLERLENSAYALRALLLRRDFQKKRAVHPSSILSLGCVKLIKVDSSECCEEKSDCIVRRTEVKVPKPLRRDTIEPFFYVGSVFGTKINYATEIQHQGMGNRRFDTKDPYYLYKNGYIYVINSNAKKVVVRDPFDDPRKAEEFDTCEESDCSTEVDSFTPEDMISIIEDELMRKERGQQDAYSKNRDDEANV